MKFIRSNYQVGNIRVIKRFAWLPTRLTDVSDSNQTHIVWLERFYSIEEFWSSGQWLVRATSQSRNYLPIYYNDRKVFKE